MFYNGSLQDGIALAVQEKRLVACLIRDDDNEECQIWEQDWLRQEHCAGDVCSRLGDALGECAVLLRINHGSQEAAHLAAFCAYDKVPILVVISNGQVIERLESGIAKENFTTKIEAILESRATTAPTGAPAQSDDAAAQAPTTAPSPPQTQTTSNAAIQSLLSERAARLEAERQKREVAEREARKRKAAEQRAEARSTSTEAVNPAAKSRRDWLEEQAKRKKEAKSDRERVLKMIESDKAERREREAQRRMAARSEISEDTGSVVMTAKVEKQIPESDAPSCAIQIRLIDGSSVRTRFEAQDTIGGAVRSYVRTQSQTDMPYTIRQLRTPEPSRIIDVTEEQQSLQTLGLLPSAILVLVPVGGYADAYASQSNGYVATGLSMGYGLVSGVLGLLRGAATSIIGLVTAMMPAPVEVAAAAGTRPLEPETRRGASGSGQNPPTTRIKMRTLADQRAESERNEFYNGNQLDFEPRGKDEDTGDDA